jgi:hypothetical protein
MDDELRREEDYRGHRIFASAVRERARSWRWSYQVDEDARFHSRNLAGQHLPTGEQALQRALLAARARIDALIPPGRG